MSLDITLTVDTPVKKPKSSGIFIRKNGQTVEISDEEWDILHPGVEPVRVIDEGEESNVVFDANITHNLNKMAEAASLYTVLWKPEEVDITKARQLLIPLSEGLVALVSDPNKFKVYNPANGWGDYDTLVEFVAKYLAACIAYPDATVGAYR